MEHSKAPGNLLQLIHAGLIVASVGDGRFHEGRVVDLAGKRLKGRRVQRHCHVNGSLIEFHRLRSFSPSGWARLNSKMKLFSPLAERGRDRQRRPRRHTIRSSSCTPPILSSRPRTANRCSCQRESKRLEAELGRHPEAPFKVVACTAEIWLPVSGATFICGHRIART